MQIDQAVVDGWRAAAPFWEKYRETIHEMFSPVANALTEDGDVRHGQVVLDVATGPGEPASTLAAQVGTEGKVWGIDPAPEMVAVARRAAARLGLGNAQFEVAFADDLPFPDGTFDAVVSRFGAMFFPSPGDAIREILRVLKPGGKLALAVWGSAENNPFFHSIQRVLQRFIDSPPLEPDALDAFRFAAPGKLRGILAEAGAVAPSERLLQFAIQAPVSAEEFWTLRTEMSEKLREKVAALPKERLAEAKRQCLEALGEYSTGSGMSFPAQVLIVSGARIHG